MGRYRNRKCVAVLATLAALAVLSFNVILVLQTFGVDIAGLPH
jgi:manganese transport protein